MSNYKLPNMSPLVIISVIMQLHLFIYVKGATVPDVPAEVVFNITSRDHNFTAIENVKLHLRVSVTPEERILLGSCSMTCKINGTTEVTSSVCEVLLDNNQSQYIDVITNRTVTRKDSDKWNCMLIVAHRSRDENGTLTTGSISKSVIFQLIVKSENIPWYQSWIMIVAVGVPVLLVIIGQTICIIHFKRQAKVVRRQAEWTSRRGSGEDVVRYSKMPIQKIKVEQSPESRESGIYEALDNIRVARAPVPPPIKTLPRKDVSHNSTPAPLQSPSSETSTTSRTLTNGMLLPFTNSLLRNKTKKSKQLKESDNTRSSVDRIKERPPLPLPSDELYEAMENSPMPQRKEPKKIEAKKNEEFRGFNTISRQTPPPVFGSGAKTLQSQVLPSQLKEELRKRVNTVIEPPRQKELPLRTAPFNSGLPPRGAQAKLAPPVPRPEKSTPSTPVPLGLKPKPPPPVKPKQLHPLPPTPYCRPESIHVTTEGGDDDSDDEDWTYEPLPAYPIYSI